LTGADVRLNVAAKRFSVVCRRRPEKPTAPDVLIISSGGTVTREASPCLPDRCSFLKTAGAVTAAVTPASYGALPARAAIAANTARAATAGLASGNPFITSIYTADPDAFVCAGRLYVDTDHDEAPLGATDFVMREWHVTSTTDTVNDRRGSQLTLGQAYELVRSATLISSATTQSVS